MIVPMPKIVVKVSHKNILRLTSSEINSIIVNERHKIVLVPTRARTE